MCGMLLVYAAHASACCLVCVTLAGSYFVLSLFDKLWHPYLTEAEALDMMKKGEHWGIEL